MAELIDIKLRGLILDMDGVIWRDTEPLGDLPKIFEAMANEEWQVTLATNNATRSVDQYVEKLANFGVAIEPWQVINSALTTAEHLREKFPSGGPVYIVGEAGLLEALGKYGFYHQEKDALAVIGSMDRTFDYQKLYFANQNIRQGAEFIGTNPDKTFPSPEGITPGAGSILAAIETASETSPLIIGKPKKKMFELAIQRMDLIARECLVVGDRLETDIAGGQAMGCMTGLVLSGVTDETQARAWNPPPTFIAPDLSQLLNSFIEGDPGVFITPGI